MVKAKREAAAAEAAAEATIAGWPAERCRLLEEAARLEVQAAPVAELEMQRGSALVQALATSGCLLLIAGCLSDATDKWVLGNALPLGRGGRRPLRRLLQLDIVGADQA